MKLLWLTLTQVTSSCEIEFLPVYTPSEYEKRDPKLFATNVRAVMAKALGVPVMDYTYDDCKLMTKAKEMNLPNATNLVEVQKLRNKIGLNQKKIEQALVDCPLIPYSCINYLQFTQLLNIPGDDLVTQQLFHLYDPLNLGVIDFREYLLGVLALSPKQETSDIVRLAFQIYDSTGHMEVNYEDFSRALGHTVAMPAYECNDMFVLISKNGYVSYEKFVQFASRKAEFSAWFNMDRGDSCDVPHHHFGDNHLSDKKTD